ncbi:MAG: HAD-IB family phosphatase [Candidatus Geothermarchaeales archaeon]
MTRVMMCKKPGLKLIAFDLDGTLVRETSSWGKIHEHFGTVESEEKSLQEYTDGRISYEEFMRRDIDSWPKPLHIDDISRILMDYELEEGVEETIKKIKRMGLKTALISAGIDLLAEEIARILDIDHFIANGLETGKDGFLTGEGIMRVDPLKKHEALEKLIHDLGIRLEDVVAVGDTKYDKSFLEKAGVGVAVGFDEELSEVADFHIESMKELPSILEKLLSKSDS